MEIGLRVSWICRSIEIVLTKNYATGQQRALTLVQPHSKVVLQEAVKADSDFLARSNIMDYSCVLYVSTR